MINKYIVDDLYAFTNEDNADSPADYHIDTIKALQDVLDDFILSYHPLAYSYGDDQDIQTGRLVFEYEINNIQYNISLVHKNEKTIFAISHNGKEDMCSFEEFPKMIKNIPVLVP